MQRRDQVVVFLAGLVVEQNFALDGVFHQRFGDRRAPLRIARGCRYGGFKRVVRGARVAVGEHRNLPQKLVGDFDALRAKAALFVIQGAAEQRLHLIS